MCGRGFIVCLVVASGCVAVGFALVWDWEGVSMWG